MKKFWTNKNENDKMKKRTKERGETIIWQIKLLYQVATV